MKTFKDTAAVYGLSATDISDAQEFIKQKQKEGKLIGFWDNNMLKLYLDPSSHQERLQDAFDDSVSLSEQMEIPVLNRLWKIFDFFVEGKLDYLVANDAMIAFPEKARGLITMIGKALEANKADNAKIEKDAGEKEIDIDIPDVDIDTENDPFILNLWGKLYSFTQKFGDAGKCFRRAIDANKLYSEPYSNLGALLFKHGSQRDSFVLFTEALLKHPMNMMCQLNFFDAGYELKEYEAMVKVIEKIAPEVEEAIEFKHHLAICYQRCSRFEDAQKILKEILEVYPDDEDAKLLLQNFTQENQQGVTEQA